jgi:hypothetical protein
MSCTFSVTPCRPRSPMCLRVSVTPCHPPSQCHLCTPVQGVTGHPSFLSPRHPLQRRAVTPSREFLPRAVTPRREFFVTAQDAWRRGGVRLPSRQRDHEVAAERQRSASTGRRRHALAGSSAIQLDHQVAAERAWSGRLSGSHGLLSADHHRQVLPPRALQAYETGRVASVNRSEIREPNARAWAPRPTRATRRGAM